MHMVFMLFDNEVREMVLEVREIDLMKMAVLRYNYRYRSRLSNAHSEYFCTLPFSR